MIRRMIAGIYYDRMSFYSLQSHGCVYNQPFSPTNPQIGMDKGDSHSCAVVIFKTEQRLTVTFLWVKVWVRMDRREEFQRWLVKEMRLPTMEADTLHRYIFYFNLFLQELNFIIRIFTPQMSEMWSNYSKRLVDPKRYERFKRICYIKHGDERKEPISNRNKSLYSDPSFVDAELVLQKTTISDIQLPRIFYGPEECRLL